MYRVNQLTTGRGKRGGGGIDTLALAGANLSVKITNGASRSALNTNNSSQLGSLEICDLTGNGNNSPLSALPRQIFAIFQNLDHLMPVRL